MVYRRDHNEGGFKMIELLAFHAEQGNPDVITSFTESLIISLPLPAGLYVVHGRFTLENHDGDGQNAGAGIRVRGSLAYIDRRDFRLGGAGSSTSFVQLQAVLRLDEADTIDLMAATYQGNVQGGSLIAFNVEGIVPPI